MKDRNQTNFDKLLELDPYDKDLKKRESLFIEALNENYFHHYKNCEPYQKFCKRRGFDGKSNFTSAVDIPSLPVQAFKEYGNFLKSSSNHNRENLILQSSATSGRPSSVSVDRVTAKRQIISMSKILMSYVGSEKKPFIVVDADPKYSSGNILGARGAATTGFLNFAKSATYLLKEKKNVLSLDVKKLEEVVKFFDQNHQKPIVFGFTYVLYEHILKNDNIFGDVNLGADSLLIHIGGWKKLEDKKVSKREFNSLVEKRLGIKPNNIIDVYGFTEHMGLIYPSFGEGYKTTSIFSDVIARDPVTFAPLEEGKEGILEFISPLPYSYPGLAITTDDLGIVENFRGDKNSEFFGKKFIVTGRAKNAEVRGCGDIMSEYVQIQSSSKKKVQDDVGIGVLYHGGLTTNKNNYFKNLDQNLLPKISDFGKIANQLKKSRKKLDKYSIDELISFLSEVSKKWMEDEDLAQFKQHGLSFLMTWLNSKNLRNMADQALNGQRGIIDDFASDKFQNNRQILAVPRGIVCHWLAGNVPLLGMLALAQSIITKNANILRAPSKNSGVLPALLQTLANTNLTLKTGRKIIGKDIADSIALVYFDKNNKEASENFSKIGDARVAWGGKDAIEAVLSLPKKHTCEDIIFGPKLSYMVIGKETLTKETNLNKLFRRVATDASVFDQYACASPHTIFVEEGGEISPREFAKNLADHMEKASLRIPKEPADAGTAGNINSKRMYYEFTSELWHSSDTTWSVLFDEKGQSGLVDPTYSRVITVRSIKNALSAAKFASQDIQTIGLSLNNERRREFALEAARNGAARFPDIGRMTYFDSPWDGLLLIQLLVRHISLGGPFT